MIKVAEGGSQHVTAKTAGTPDDGTARQDPAQQAVQTLEELPSDDIPRRPEVSQMPHQKEDILKLQKSSALQDQETDTVKQIETRVAGEDANVAFRSTESKQRDLEQRLLTYARRLQEASPDSADREKPNELRPADDDPFSIQMPLNRTTSRMSIPVAVEVLAEVEKDATSVANNLVQLMATLRAQLADVTHCSLEHLECHSEAARGLHEAVLDAASSGNRFINECQRLDQEMRGVGELAAQIKAMRQLVDHFEGQLNRSLPSR